MGNTLRRHWPEFLCESAGLGLFMLSACVFGTLLECMDSPLRQAIPSPFARRVAMGLAMGATAVALIYSPWGQRSGAHLNPATTLAFLRLGKIDPRDAVWYLLSQTAGGLAGVLLAWLILGRCLAEWPVRFVATAPGDKGAGVAFLTEAGLAFVMMSSVLAVSNSRFFRWTGMFAGLLVAVFIIAFAPLSGMSINPARTLASAIPAADFNALWIYFIAPPLGMQLAIAVRMALGRRQDACAKLHHTARHRCVFCEWRVTQAAARHPRHG